MSALTTDRQLARYYQYALWLGVFTVVYNLGEGLVSIAFGAHDQALTLFGFGVDSFIEVISGLGIVAMILRMQHHPDAPRSPFEQTALRITGIGLYVLGAGLLATAIYNVVTAHKPETALSGILVSLVSIVAMYALAYFKTQVGQRLASAPILADAACTKVCLYMSLILLASSAVYQLTGIGYVDSLGALGLIYFAVQEGREALEKARGVEVCCDD